MATNDQVLEAIDDLGKSWDKRFTRVEEKVELHDVDLRGNAKPGIKTRLKLIEDKFRNIDWATKLVLAAVVLDIIGRISGVL